MKVFSKIINKCQFSQKKDLVNILSLGFLPSVNQMHKINSKRSFENFFPTNLVYSPSSKLFQIDNIVNKKTLFPKSYPYTSSTTKILRENFKNLYEETNKIFKLKKDDLVIDIGSNDGNLLEKFKNCKVLGITPEKIGLQAIKKGIPTIIDYFTSKSANKILTKYGKAKVITATNVFAHIDDIDEVIINIKKLLKKNGIFISESHYFLSLVKTLQYDTIYHEHLRYYTILSLKNIFNKYNLKIIKVKKIPTHGGSIRVYVTRKSFKFKNCLSVNLAIKEEKKYLSQTKLKKFRDKVLMTKSKFIFKITKSKRKK